MMDRISYRVFLVLWICSEILTLRMVQGRCHHDPSSLPPLYSIRGGGEDSSSTSINQEQVSLDHTQKHNNPTLTVAILGKDVELYTPKTSSWLEDISIPNCCILVATTAATTTESGTITPIGSISSKNLLTDDESNNDDHDVSLVETLAFLCDVVVVLLPKDMSNSENDPMWSAIVQGANRRRKALSSSSLPKGHLLLVSSQSMEFSQDDQQKSLFQSVETVTTNDLPAALEKFLSKPNVLGDDGSSSTTISTLFGLKDHDDDQDMSLPFTEVMNQVYKSVGPSTERAFQFWPISAATTANSESATATTITTTAINTQSTPITATTTTNSEMVTTTPTAINTQSTPISTESPALINDASVVGDAPSSEQDNVVSILAQAQSKLASLETKVEDAMLAVAEESVDNKNNSKGMPLLFLDFGNLANEVLEEAYMALMMKQSNAATTAAGIRENVILTKIVGELQRLYREQVRLMRDYYGRRYENLLDQLALQLEEEGTITRQEAGETAGTAVEEIIENFRAASQHAIPKLCRVGDDDDDGGGGELASEFGDRFDFQNELKGLLEDIYEATNMRQPVEEQDDDAMEETSPVPLSRWQKFHASIPKWVKRLLARGLMLGVNYAQGWLAWQGLKRAAAERDRKMPKFPLF